MIIGKFESPDDRNYEGQVPTFTSSTVAIRPTISVTASHGRISDLLKF